MFLLTNFALSSFIEPTHVSLLSQSISHTNLAYNCSARVTYSHRYHFLLPLPLWMMRWRLPLTRWSLYRISQDEHHHIKCLHSRPFSVGLQSLSQWCSKAVTWSPWRGMGVCTRWLLSDRSTASTRTSSLGGFDRVERMNWSHTGVDLDAWRTECGIALIWWILIKMLLGSWKLLKFWLLGYVSRLDLEG